MQKLKVVLRNSALICSIGLGSLVAIPAHAETVSIQLGQKNLMPASSSEMIKRMQLRREKALAASRKRVAESVARMQSRTQALQNSSVSKPAKKLRKFKVAKKPAIKTATRPVVSGNAAYQNYVKKLQQSRQQAAKDRAKREKLRIQLRKEVANAKGEKQKLLRRKLVSVTYSRDAANQEIARREAIARKAAEAARRKAAAARAARSSGGKIRGGGRRAYSGLIAKYARANGVPVSLAHAVVFSESTYRANARGGAGEIGLMQIKPSTARGVGYRGSTRGLYDPATNLRYGMKYLGGAYRKAGGNVCRTILKYNAGHGATRMNPTSSRYCRKVRRLM